MGSYPPDFSLAHKRALRYRSAKFMIKAGKLFRKNYEGIYLRCLEKDQAKEVLKQFHYQEGGTGHASTMLAHQIL